jgi:hypothetical protein
MFKVARILITSFLCKNYMLFLYACQIYSAIIKDEGSELDIGQIGIISKDSISRLSLSSSFILSLNLSTWQLDYWGRPRNHKFIIGISRFAPQQNY